MTIRCERVYDFKKRRKDRDEYAVLVDRVWPRGVKKEELGHDEWAKSLAPSSDLRRWFGHDPERWDGFRERYREELKEVGDELDNLRERAAKQPVTLLFAARDTEHNQAVVLADMLEKND